MKQASFCLQCGSSITKTQKFCRACGSRNTLSLPSLLRAMDITASNASQFALPFIPASGRMKHPIAHLSIIVGVLLFIIIGLASYFFVSVLRYGMRVQPPITSGLLNTTLNYAGVDITVLTAQQAQNFVDDPNLVSDGMLRLQIKAINKTGVQANLFYSTMISLLLPDGKVVAPSWMSRDSSNLAVGTTRTNTIDFAVSTSLRIDQLSLRLGEPTKAQMDLPLTAHPDLSRYMPKVIALNKQLDYFNLNWTLTGARSQLCLDAQPASKGMRYVIITLTLANPLFQTAIPGSAFNYASLKADDTAITPQSTTLPVAIEAGANIKAGTITFLVPQSSKSLKLILSSANSNQDGFKASTADFQF